VGSKRCLKVGNSVAGGREGRQSSDKPAFRSERFAGRRALNAVRRSIDRRCRFGYSRAPEKRLRVSPRRAIGRRHHPQAVLRQTGRCRLAEFLGRGNPTIESIKRGQARSACTFPRELRRRYSFAMLSQVPILKNSLPGYLLDGAIDAGRSLRFGSQCFPRSCGAMRYAGSVLASPVFAAWARVPSF
jgi:hypothetical protein